MNTTHPMNPPTHPTGPGYTPGPWSEDPEGEIAYGIEAQGKLIAYVDKLPNKEETAANCRLIALAPEMAEALQDAARCLSEYRSTGSMAGWDKTLSQARAILARVNGGAS